MNKKSITIREIATGKEETFLSHAELADYLMISRSSVPNFLRGKTVMNNLFKIVEIDGEPYTEPEHEPVRQGRPSIKYFDSVTIKDKVTGEITTCYNNKELLNLLKTDLPPARLFLQGAKNGRLRRWYELIDIKTSEDCMPLDYTPYTRPRRKKKDDSLPRI